ncbi:MAG: cytochrome c [Acidimicrobiales bacterium]
MLTSGCGIDDGPPLSATAAAGRDLAADAGCMSCHGDNGTGGVGPAWTGLAGSTVELSDGTTILADADYLVRSIADPAAEQVASYTLAMPTNSLTDDQVNLVVAYIQELK